MNRAIKSGQAYCLLLYLSRNPLCRGNALISMEEDSYKYAAGMPSLLWRKTLVSMREVQISMQEDIGKTGEDTNELSHMLNGTNIKRPHQKH